VTQALDFARTEITFSGGLRYAYLEKHFNAVIPGVDFLTARHDFEGFGPTIATEIRLPCSFWADDPCDPCGQCDPCDPCACTPCGGWALYGGGRYSILFGHSWAYGENGTDPFHYRLTEVMSIGEIEVGAEWTGPTPVGGMFLFRVGYEGQVWYEAGSPSNVGGDLGFRGVNLKFGIEY